MVDSDSEISKKANFDAEGTRVTPAHESGLIDGHAEVGGIKWSGESCPNLHILPGSGVAPGNPFRLGQPTQFCPPMTARNPLLVSVVSENVLKMVAAERDTR